MNEISSPKELEQWLEGKPKIWGQVLAHRSALRVLPILEIQSKFLNDLKKQLPLAVVRASLISGVAVISSTPEIRDAAVEAVDAIDDAVDASLAMQFSHIAHVAHAAADVAARASMRASDHAVRAASASVRAFDHTAQLTRVNDVAIDTAVDGALNQDVSWLQNHENNQYCPQNLLLMPLWQGAKNPLLLEWESLKGTLIDLDHNWQFWIEWYQSKLDGTEHSGLTETQKDDLYYQIATLPNEFWEKEPAVINQIIADLIGREKIKDKIKNLLEKGTVLGTNTVNSAEFRSNVVRNKAAISLSCASVIVQVEEYKKTVSGSNSLEPELKEQLLGTLENVTEAVNNIGNSLETGSDVISDEGLEEVASYFSRFCEVISCELENYIAPENIGKAVVPTGIILSCGGLGALLGGGIGFGVGGFIGKLITNNLKPKEIVDKIEENIDNPN